MSNVVDLEIYRQQQIHMDIYLSMLSEQYEAQYFEPPEDDD